MLADAIRTMFRTLSDRVPSTIASMQSTCLVKTVCFATIALAIFIRTPVWTLVGLLAFGVLLLPGSGPTRKVPVTDEDRR